MVRSPLTESRRLFTLTGLLAFVLAAAAFTAAVVMNTAPPRTGVAGAPTGLGSGREEIPASLSAAVERERYAIVPEHDTGVSFGRLRGGLQTSTPEPAYVAENPSQGLAARFTEAGVKLGPGGRKAAWHSRLRLTGVGYDDARLERPAAATLSAAENRIELRRGPLTEWYVNERRGLEQGFTLRSPPARETGGPLVLRMTVGGDLRPHGDRRGGTISLVDRSGHPVLSYGELHAYDAAGRTVPARMSADGNKLSLLVDDARAAYPLTIDPFVAQAKLDPPPSAAAGKDLFGRSVAVSGDTALVGVVGADTVAGTDAGAAYVFVRSGTSWSLQQKLTAPDGAASDNFGWSVALSGDTALIGIGGPAQNPGPGSAYVFVRGGTSWSLQQKLTAADGAAGDRFGQSVALDGDTALVAAMNDDNANGTDAGSVYVFARGGTSWSLQQQLIAPDGTVADLFGSSVALSGDTALVGARLGDTLDGGPDAGSAYVFIRSGMIWSFQQKLTAPDGEGNDLFGWSVALSGDTALVGVPVDNTAAGTDAGSAYVFTRSLMSWSFQQQLIAPDGAASDRFGESVALNGDTALVGTPRDNVAGFESGSAYAFIRDVTTWSLQQKLTASDGRSGDQFGTAVALSIDTALVGAPLDDNGGLSDGGSAYALIRSGSSWSLQQKLQLAEGALPRDGFGRSIALSGDTALVGSPNDDTIPGSVNAGTAYVFVRSGTTWSLQQRLTASDGMASDNFGTSVALDGDNALVGSPADDNAGGTDAGSAYAFVRSGTTWSLQGKLTQPDGAAGDGFGRSVRLSVDTALVGAPGDDTTGGADAGSAHVFIRSGSSWSFERRLTRGMAGDKFGSSLGLSGQTALVGAPGDDTTAGADAGSGHVFVRSGTSWNFQRMFTAPVGAAGDGFGGSAELSGDTALVGAPADDTAAGTDAGSADVFVRSGTSWSFQKQLTASDGAASDNFGSSVAVGDVTALVGAPFDDTPSGPDAGSAYSFTRSGTTWSAGQKLTAGTSSDRFGSSVAQSLNTYLIGAPQDAPNRQAPGTAYVFIDSGSASPIQHVVLMYQENHSFDDVLGRWCVNTGRCDGTKQGKLPDGTTVPLRTAGDLVPQVSHTTFAQNQAINGGQMDGFGNMWGCREQENYQCLVQYAPTQIPNLIGLANRFAVSDRTFQLSSVPSFGAHIEVVAATLAGFTGDTPYQGTGGDGPGWGCDSKHDVDWRASDGTVLPMPSCIPDYRLDPSRFPYGGAYKATQVEPTETIMDRLDQAGLSWKLYTGSGASYAWAICPYFAQCRYTAQKAGMVDNEQVIQDAANGALPNFSVVLPTSENSQHNNWSMAMGDNWIGRVMGAIENGPDWGSTAVFIFYDDCGCFYDHVPPPPGFGIRTPMVIASPWAKPGYTDSINASYASPLAFAEHNFGLAPLTNRDGTAYDYSNVFNFSQQPLAPVQMTTTKLSPREIERVRKAPKDEDDPT